MRPPRRRLTIQVQFDRIPPGIEIGPHAHGVETIVYVAAGEIVYQHGPGLGRQVRVRAGDVLYEAPEERHLVRNEGSIDALALLASVGQSSDEETVDLPGQGSAAGRREAWLAGPVRRGSTARLVETSGMRHRILVEPGDFGSGTFTVSEVDLAPGASTGWHRHQRSEHVIVVLEGRGTVRVGSFEETLEPLKGIRVEIGLPHAITNTGRTRLRYYLCATPAADPLSGEEIAPPA